MTTAEANTSSSWRWRPSGQLLIGLLFLIAPSLVQVVAARYTEEERIEMYKKRGHTFPFKKYIPDTAGWRKIMDRRFDQVRALRNSQMKWDGWIQTANSAVIVPNFTEFGWGLTQAPDLLTLDIQQAIYDGLPNARSEGLIDVIDGPTAPLFIERPDLNKRALEELQPILEAWAGVELVPAIAYGFRVYRNESSLWMHTDRAQTHVISCIYHIASSDDSEPWPIVIEDYEGNTQMAHLTPGDMLLYESSKNFHGRPTKFDGSWYTSLFVHFYPKGEWRREDHDVEAHYAVPPNWYETVPDTQNPSLKVIGTSLLEPSCPNNWCTLETAEKVYGPGSYGTVLTTGGKRYSLDLEDEEAEEL
eukprot:CAMPEP_0116137794 /NCGR_PEP_ID=MMETSP0329-20121206/12432_1 /TAXON_ID=697910 /ORGANISM="Pseudo-nitzschia arenysensis, Strain B593" /LENGTH=359 /DNA_ID=CAMNT_0003632721 /DNA_START=43 /DNA_END=1122 /DNA_ORIENTATION=-